MCFAVQVMGLFDIIDHVLWLFMNVSDITEHNSVQFLQIADLVNEDTPQIYTLCGRGPRSTLRVLRHGLEVRTVFFSFCKFVFPLNTFISYTVHATIQFSHILDSWVTRNCVIGHMRLYRALITWIKWGCLWQVDLCTKRAHKIDRYHF